MKLALLVSAMIVGVCASAVFVASCSSEKANVTEPGNLKSKSNMLQEIERRYAPSPVGSSKSSGRVADIFTDVIGFLGDVADVTLADLQGAAVGAGVGGVLGAVIYDAEAEREKIRNAEIIGAVIFGAAASIKRVKDITADSLKPPPGTPYNSETMPTSSDSVGWLHNQAVLYGYNIIRNSPSTPIRTVLRNWGVSVRGYDATLMDSLLTEDRVQDLIDDVESTTTHAAFIVALENMGQDVEAAQLDSLYSDLSYLESLSYDNAAAVSLIQA